MKKRTNKTNTVTTLKNDELGNAKGGTYQIADLRSSALIMGSPNTNPRRPYQVRFFKRFNLTMNG